MNKPEQAISRIEKLHSAAVAQEKQTSHVINLRKKLVESGSLILRGYKDLIKELTRRGQSTKHLHKVYREAVHEYQQNVAVLGQLKRLNAEARNQVFDFGQVLGVIKPNDKV